MPAKVTIDGDARGIVAELARMQKAQAAANQEFRTAATESQRLDRIARQALRNTRTEAERFTAEMEDLGAAFKSGKIDLDTYNRAVRRLKDGYREAADGAEEAFGPVSLDRLSQFAAGIFGINAILSTVRDNFAEVRQEQERLVQLFNQAAPSSGQLGQIARGPEDARRLRQQADELFAAGAVRDLQEANRVIFALRSTGQEADADLFRQLGRAQLVGDLSTTINTLDSLADAFGQLDIQSNRELVSQLLELSKSTQVGFEQVGQAAAQIGGIAKQAGIDFEQAGAAIGVISDEQGGVERARTRVAAFLREARREELLTGDLVGDIRAIQARVDEGESLDELIGKSSEAQEGFLALAGRLEDLTEIIANTRAATDTVGQAIQNNLIDPVIQSDVARRSAEAGLAIQERAFAVEANIRETLDADIQRLASEVGFNARERAFARTLTRGAEVFGFDLRGRQLREIESTAALFGNESVLEGVRLARQQLEELRKLNEAERDRPPTRRVPEQAQEAPAQ